MPETGEMLAVIADRLARMEARQEDVFRRLTHIESAANTSFNKAIEQGRAEQAQMDRIEQHDQKIKVLIDEQAKSSTAQTRMLWVLVIGLAGQLLKSFGVGALTDLIK